MAGHRKAIADLGGYFAKIARVFSRDYGVQVLMGPAGTPAAVDLERKIITLPCDIDMAGPALRQTIEGLLDHEAGHVRAEVDFKGEERASALLRKMTSPVQHHLFNVFEDARQERVSMKRWPGVKRNIETKNDVMFRSGTSAIEERVADGDPPPDADVFIWALNKRLRQGDWPTCLSERAKKLADECEDIMERAEHMWCPRDALTLAKEMQVRLAELADPPPPPMPAPDMDDSETEPSPSDGRGESSSPKSDESDESDEEPDDDDGESSDEPDDSDSEDPGDEGDEDEDDDDGAGSSGPKDDEEDSEEESDGGSSDDEGDDEDEEPDEEPDEDEDGEGDSESPEDSEDEDGEEDSDGDGSEDGDGDASEEGGASDDSETGDGAAPSEPDLDTTDVANKILEKLAEPHDSSPEAEAWANVNHALTSERAESGTYHLPHPSAVRLDRIVVQDKAPAAYRKALELARPTISVLVRRLTLWLRAQVPQLIGDQIEGDIDEDVLVYVGTGENRIFEAEKPGLELDTAWCVLIDQSGSMGSGDLPHRRSYWTRIAAIALGEALHRCRIPFEVWGWDTDDHVPAVADKVHTRVGNQRHFQYKTFDEPWPRVRQRTGNITGYLENDDVSAIYFAAQRLIQRKEKHKVLLVLTDGQPTHSGLRAWSYAWAKQQLADTLRRVRHAGITDIGVGIQCDYVKEMYDNHIIVNDLSTFAKDLVNLVRKTVRAA